MSERMIATWLRDWAIEWSTNHGELWISRIRRSVDGWTRTVTFDARPTGLDVERVAAVVDRMPAVEATIEIPCSDAALVGIRVSHSEAQEPPIAEINALVVQLPRRPMRIEIVRASNDKDAPEAPALNELAQATAALDEARAKCDELRDALGCFEERDIRWRIASGADTPKDLRERLDEAREIVGCGERESFLARLRAIVRERDAASEMTDSVCGDAGRLTKALVDLEDRQQSTQTTLDEALSIQSQIWDAVGGQRDGESLVDAVRRMARSDAESMRILTEVCSIVCPRAPDEHIIDATRRLVEERNELLEQVNDRSCKVCECLCVVPFDTRKCPACGVVFAPRAEVSASAQYASFVTEDDRAAPTDAHPLADAIAGLALDEIAALSAAGWVMRWTAPSMRWVTPGGAALDPATWRETLRREAARLLGKRYVVSVEGVVMVEAKMGEMDGALSEASKRVAEWPEWKQSDDVKRRREEFDARVEAMCAKRCTEHDSLLISGDGVVARIEAQRVCALDEAREAGRAEMRAELDQARAAVARVTAEYQAANTNLRNDVQALIDDARRKLGAFEHESLFGAAARVVSERDAWQMSTEEGNEIAACLRAELSDARAYVGALGDEALTAAIRRVGNETAGIAVERTVQERDAAYQRGQEAMLGDVRRMITRDIDQLQASGGRIDAAPLRRFARQLGELAVAKAPTAAASVPVSDEVDHRCAATVRALKNVGVSNRRSLDAVTIVEFEGAANPDAAHAECLRIASETGRDFHGTGQLFRERIRAAAAVAKTPTVFASEVTGEAIPGAVSAETAGAGESVARSVDLATIWKGRAGGYRAKAQIEADANKRGYHSGVADAYATCADEIGFVCGKLRDELAGARAEVERLNRCLCDSMEQLAEESERWRTATGASSPDEAAADAQRDHEVMDKLRAEVERQRGIVEGYAAKAESYAAEIAALQERLGRVRYERGRSDDALKAIEDALMDAGAPRQSDESLADAVRRALDNREVLAPSVDHNPRVGDRVFFLYTGGGEEPGIIRRVREDGKFDLWTTSNGQPFVYGVTRSRFRLRD